MKHDNISGMKKHLQNLLYSLSFFWPIILPGEGGAILLQQLNLTEDTVVFTSDPDGNRWQGHGDVIDLLKKPGYDNAHGWKVWQGYDSVQFEDDVLVAKILKDAGANPARLVSGRHAFQVDMNRFGFMEITFEKERPLGDGMLWFGKDGGSVATPEQNAPFRLTNSAFENNNLNSVLLDFRSHPLWSDGFFSELGIELRTGQGASKNGRIDRIHSIRLFESARRADGLIIGVAASSPDIQATEGANWGGRGMPVDSLAYRGSPPAVYFGEARWLRDHRLEQKPVSPVFDLFDRKNRETNLNRDLRGVLPNDEGTENMHTYFRRGFTLAGQPRQAVLRFAADDHAKVFVNGHFIGQLRANAYPFATPFVEFEVSKYLRQGENVIAAHAYYHGAASRAFTSGANRAGFILNMQVEYGDGRFLTVKTDPSWRYFQSSTFSYILERFSQSTVFPTQFSENMDMRKEPIDWKKVGFDDSGWSQPLIGEQDHLFIQSITPPLAHYRLEPVVFVEKSPGRWFVDFGHYITGHLNLIVRGESGQQITILQAEELLQPGDPGYGEYSVRYRLRANCIYRDEIILRDGLQPIEFYDYRGFRYAEIHDLPEQPEIWAKVRHHPLEWEASFFESSDPMLNKIWEISKRAVQMGSQDIIVDCPQREKGQYGGDSYMTALSQLFLSADSSLVKKALLDYHHSQHFDKGILAVAPGNFRQNLLEWSLVWPLMLEHYYNMTGDERLVRELFHAGALDALFGFFAPYVNDAGMLQGVHRSKQVLVDWPRELRGTFDHRGTANGINSVANSFYYGALRAAASMALVADQPESALKWKAEADQLFKSFQELLGNKETGLYHDGIREDGSRSPSQSLHANAFALGFGLVCDSSVPAVVDLIRSNGMEGGIYLAPYLLRGLWAVGEGDLAFTMMTTGKNSWAEMVRQGATATSETWSPEQKSNMSWCHPAGGVPVWHIIQHVAGLSPAEPGFRGLRVSPQIPESLEWFNLKFPTAAGNIEASYNQDEGLKLTIPPGMPVSNIANFSLNAKL